VTALGLGHRSHPWIGRTVTDTRTGRTGILRAIAPDVNRPRIVAWLAPVGGGVEWTTDPKALDEPEPITLDTHPKGTAR
jgi:hypothetical protein